MAFTWALATKVFAALFTIMSPVANVPVFLSHRVSFRRRPEESSTHGRSRVRDLHAN